MTRERFCEFERPGKSLFQFTVALGLHRGRNRQRGPFGAHGPRLDKAHSDLSSLTKAPDPSRGKH